MRFAHVGRFGARDPACVGGNTGGDAPGSDACRIDEAGVDRLETGKPEP